MLKKIFVNLTINPKAYAHLQCKNASQLMACHIKTCQTQGWR